MGSRSQLPISPPRITGYASLVKEWNTSAVDGILTFARVRPAPFQLLTEDRFPRHPITVERGHLAGKLCPNVSGSREFLITTEADPGSRLCNAPAQVVRLRIIASN